MKALEYDLNPKKEDHLFGLIPMLIPVPTKVDLTAKEQSCK